MSPEGWVLVEEKGPEFTGTSLWNVLDGRHRDLVPFDADAKEPGAQGDVTDDFAIVKVIPDQLSPNTFRIYGYRIADGTLWLITKNTVDKDGQPMPSTWDPPILNDSHAAFVLATGAAGRRTLYFVDMATGTRRSALNETSLIGAQRYGDDFVVIHAGHRRTIMQTSGRAGETPDYLTEHDGELWVVPRTDGSLTYGGGGNNLNEVWYTPNAEQVDAELLVRTSPGGIQDVPAFGKHSLLLYLNNLGTYALDLRTFRATRLTRVLGGFAGAGDHILVPADPGGIKESATTGVLWTLGRRPSTGTCTAKPR